MKIYLKARHLRLFQLYWEVSKRFFGQSVLVADDVRRGAKIPKSAKQQLESLDVRELRIYKKVVELLGPIVKQKFNEDMEKFAVHVDKDKVTLISTARPSKKIAIVFVKAP